MRERVLLRHSAIFSYKSVDVSSLDQLTLDCLFVVCKDDRLCFANPAAEIVEVCLRLQSCVFQVV